MRLVCFRYGCGFIVKYQGANCEKACHGLHAHETASNRPSQSFRSRALAKRHHALSALTAFEVPVTLRLSNSLALDQTLNMFFSITNAACRLYEYDEAQSTLMLPTDITALKRRTESSIEDRALHCCPSLGFQPSQVINFALQHLNQTDLSPPNMVILDAQSNEEFTCLLLSRKELSYDAHDFVQTRSDFESAVVTLNTIETGCGGADSQLSTDYPLSDRALRISARDRSS